MSIYLEPRDRLINWVREQLMGSAAVLNECDNEYRLYGGMPTIRFPCGALYPASQWDGGIDTATELVEFIGKKADDDNNEGNSHVRRYTPPSSLGLSFLIKGEDIRFQVLISAVAYTFHTKYWTRYELPDLNMDIVPHEDTNILYHDKGRIDVRWRQFNNGWLVTVSFCNTQNIDNKESNQKPKKEPNEESINRAKNTLFEVKLRCVIDSGDVEVYPRVDHSLLDEEEQEVELQYNHRPIFAVGHGCSATWEFRDNKVHELRADMMPVVEVPQMTADTGTSQLSVLSLAKLAEIDHAYKTLLPELNEFINGYADWVASQQAQIATLTANDSKAAKRMVSRMNTAILRMRSSLKLLSNDVQVRLAFALANRAMYEQMRQYDLVQGKSSAQDSYCWRPFQLAFLLTAIESTANQDSEYRDIVDLIWFPTGGGKTEAYLGLIALQISLRRLRHPDTGGGTAIFMRYTLRLLTRDQFIRASRMICALELIRRARHDLGSQPITIGMWAGGATSPNQFKYAFECVKNAQEAANKNGKHEPISKLVLNQCPWCAQQFKPWINYQSSEHEFHFVCKNLDCAFHSPKHSTLPVNVVDEALYKSPPTMVVATIDKFARFAWDERSNALFGGTQYRPPELIIQDELHLIASALGSVAGCYEAAIDSVLQLRGVYPKYIASTATIRMAAQQVQQLYGREVAVFPPPGLSCDDAYFARTVPLEEKAGRKYIGYLAPLFNTQESLAPLAAALLCAPEELFSEETDKEALLDAWWTQVGYHGSLRGVGHSHTTFAGEVRHFMEWILNPPNEQKTTQHTSTDSTKENFNSDESSNENPPSAQKTARQIKIEQLTSKHSAEENSKIFANLSKPKNLPDCVDAVLATNMISVGLDVSRLALMIINGQPLTTAEYIQASSRVGRGDVPGVVFAHYYRTQARSLSHYESFRPYHEAFYRFVEPTSVTPYTYQARMRAMPAALVILLRHSVNALLPNSAAGKFDIDNPNIANALRQFKLRCQQAATDMIKEVHAHIDTFMQEWQVEVSRSKTNKRQLSYQVADNETGSNRLLYNHGDRQHGLWMALQSMRHVEDNAMLAPKPLINEYRQANYELIDKGLIPSRLSDMLSLTSVGSIVLGGNGEMVIVHDTREWPLSEPILYMERVKQMLGITEELRKPPVAAESRQAADRKSLIGPCVPTTRFPAYMRCTKPNCGRLYNRPQSEYRPNSEHKCAKCNSNLQQVIWVMAHPSGYIDEVPWSELAHAYSPNTCKCRTELSLIEQGKKLIIMCNSCKAAAEFKPDAPVNNNYANGSPMHPWDKNTYLSPESKQGEFRILQVHDVRIHSAVIKRALVIPPESRARKGTVVDNLYRNSADRDSINRAINESMKKTAMLKLAKKYRCNLTDITTAFQDIEHGYPLYGQQFTPGQMYESEFQAFLELRPDQRDDEDLVTHKESAAWHQLRHEFAGDVAKCNIISSVCNLVRVDRLKALEVSMGFQRLYEKSNRTKANLNPPAEVIGTNQTLPGESADNGAKLVPPDINHETGWLPAIELYGEGIFLTLDEAKLQKWEQIQAVQQRLAPLASRFGSSEQQKPNPLTPRFMLLHTLSHLLMRQIEAEGGYPASSLVERIYCANAPQPMAGILISVTVPDLAGTLGGLAQLCEPRRFLGILLRALDHSQWCSLDPTCSENLGHGPSFLNRAACHSCALVPEPACEYGNTLLDRVFVKGDAANGMPSFFGVIT